MSSGAPLALRQVTSALMSASGTALEVAMRIARRVGEFTMTSMRGVEEVHVDFRNSEVIAIGKPITITPLGVVGRREIEDLLRQYGFEEGSDGNWVLQLRRRSLMRARVETVLRVSLEFDGDRLKSLVIRPVARRVGAYGMAQITEFKEGGEEGGG